jgi:diacylglycerol kinase (ATP)
MAQPQHILIAANPKSGAVSRQALLDSLRDALVSDGFAVDVCTSLDQVEQQAAELHNAGRLRAVVSAGGDGTAAALANRITAEIPLLIFPLGTENLLAKHLGLTSDVTAARERLRASRSIALDVGLANDKMFLVMASCGFDAAVVEDMHANRKGHINRWSYSGPILRTLKRYRFPLARLIETDERALVEKALTETTRAEREQQAAWTFIFNLPRYAANLNFCPQADPVDGKLDVCTFRKPGIVKGLGYLTRLWLGSHQSMKEFSHSLATSITLRGVDGLVIPYQLDGDPGGVLPLEIRVLPGRLKLIV